MTAVGYLTSCAACAAYSENAPSGCAEYVTDVPQPYPWHCRRCRPGLVPADELAVVGAVVGLVVGRPEARWVVLARDGHLVTIRPLGLPEWPTRQVAVGEIRPQFSYERLAASRRR